MDKNNTHVTKANESAKISPAPYHDRNDVIGLALDALLRSSQLSDNSCFFLVASSRLAYQVRQLQEDGWRVLSQFEEIITTDVGRPARIKVYWMEPVDIAAAGEDGREYAIAAPRAEMARRAA